MKFLKQMRKIYKLMFQLDRCKHLEPRFSDSLEPLYRYIKDNVDMGSDTSYASKTGALLSGRGLDSERYNGHSLMDSVNRLVSVTELEGEGYLDGPEKPQSAKKLSSPKETTPRKVDVDVKPRSESKNGDYQSRYFKDIGPKKQNGTPNLDSNSK